MKNVKGIWLPGHEEHFLKFAREQNWKYQYEKLMAGLRLVKNFRCAIDVGAHVGLWSTHLSGFFKEVHAFEPLPEHRECFSRNVRGNNVILYPYALGTESKRVGISTPPGRSGESYISGGGNAEMRCLDEFDIPHVDFIKLDCEGYEYFALKGGEALLTRCKPAVVVEQKPNRASSFGIENTYAVNYLMGLGAKLYGEMVGDYFLAWD